MLDWRLLAYFFLSEETLRTITLPTSFFFVMDCNQFTRRNVDGNFASYCSIRRKKRASYFSVRRKNFVIILSDVKVIHVIFL